LKKEIGLWSALKVSFPALLKSSMLCFKVGKNAEESESTKANLKNHFKLLAFM
jgi:hypothetical protein